MKGSAEKVLCDSNEGPNITKAITCVSCASEIPSDDIENGVAPLVNLEVLLGISGMPTLNAMRFCGQKCKDRFKGAEKRNRSAQKEVIGSILDSTAVTKILKTKIRVGASVNVLVDLSSHRKVYGGQGEVVEMNYNSAIQSAELRVRCISGVYRVLPSGCSLIHVQNRHQRTRNTNDTGVFLKPGSSFLLESRTLKTLKTKMEQENKRELEELKRSVTSSSEQQLHAATDTMKKNFEQQLHAATDTMKKSFEQRVTEEKEKRTDEKEKRLSLEFEAKKIEIENLQSALASVVDREEKSNNALMSELQNIKHELTELKTQHNRSRRQITLLRKQLTESENERQRLESENARLRLESEVSQDQSIKSLWLPGVNEEQQGQPFDNRTRLLIMELLSYNVPPGSVNRTIAALLDSVFFKTEHQVHLKKKLVLPSRKFAQDTRLELGFINKATTGMAIADSERVNTWGSDASPYYGNEVLATAVQLENKNTDGTNSHENWVLPYSTLPDQKSATEARIIKENVFDRMEDAVRNVNGAIEATQSLDDFMISVTSVLSKDIEPINDFDSSGIPTRGREVDTNRIGVYRLGNAVGQSDNAPAALKVKDEMAILIAKDAVKKYGEEAWNAFSEEKKAKLIRVIKANCLRHLTNTWLGGGVKAEKECLKSEFEKEMANKPDFLRDPTDLDTTMVSLSKGYSTGKDAYGKGLGEDFIAFRVAQKKEDYVFSMVRWDHGERMDFSTKGGKITFWNRPRLVEWLRMCYFAEPNILRESMFINLTDERTINGFYIRSVINIKFTERWTPLLCNSGSSCADAAPVIQAVEKACLIPSTSYVDTFYSSEFDVFAEFLTPGSYYAQWLTNYYNQEGEAGNGKMVKINQIFEDELFNLNDVSNRCVIEGRDTLLGAWLGGMLNTIRNGEGARYLKGGDMDNLTEEYTETFQGSWATTNILESSIGSLKEIGRRVDNIPVAAAGNLAVAQQNNMFGSPDIKYLREKKRPTSEEGRPHRRELKRTKTPSGRFHSQSEVRKDAIVTAARTIGKKMEREYARNDKHNAQLARAQRQTEAETKAKDRLVSDFIKAEDSMKVALVISDRDVQSKTIEVLEAQLESILIEMTPAQQFKALKSTIERYVNGMGYRTLKPDSYTSKKRDESENITYLKAAVKNVWKTMKDDGLTFHSKAVMPRIKVKDLGSIGKTTQQRKSMEADLNKVNEEEVRQAAFERRAKVESERKKKLDAKKEKRAREKNSSEANGETQKRACEGKSPELKSKGPCVMWIQDS